MGVIEAVCVVHELHLDEHNDSGQTAIDKRAAVGRVAVRRLGLQGDRQMDVAHHGGRDQALYAYAGEDASFWAAELERYVPPGLFGENLRTTGVDVTGALIGERWAIGGDGTLVEVTAPRTPCATFQAWLDEPRWVKRFTQHGAPGAYLRVLREGSVGAGDRVEIEHRPAHRVTVGEVFGRFEPAARRRLLAAEAAGEVELHPTLRRRCRQAASRA